jgi:hypothetical protein
VRNRTECKHHKLEATKGSFIIFISTDQSSYLMTMSPHHFIPSKFIISPYLCHPMQVVIYDDHVSSSFHSIQVYHIISLHLSYILSRLSHLRRESRRQQPLTPRGGSAQEAPVPHVEALHRLASLVSQRPRHGCGRRLPGSEGTLGELIYNSIVHISSINCLH